jgi:hypothetical protein
VRLCPDALKPPRSERSVIAPGLKGVIPDIPAQKERFFVLNRPKRSEVSIRLSHTGAALISSTVRGAISAHTAGLAHQENDPVISSI